MSPRPERGDASGTASIRSYRFRYKMQQDRAVGDLLEILGWEKRRERVKSAVYQA